MSIFQVIRSNLRAGPATLRFPERVALPGGYRGAVHIDPNRCIGCAICAYVCAPSAIELTDCGSGFEWAYDPGQCTFCGRCADTCPGQALALAAARPPVYAVAGELRQVYHRAYPACPECGRPAQPVSEPLLVRAFGEVSAEVAAWSCLCEACRQRRTQLALLGASLMENESHGQ